MEERMSSRYRYFAVVGDHWTVDNPITVIRESFDDLGHSYAESFTRARRWKATDLLFRLRSGREYDEAVPITEEAARAFERRRATEPEN
jgi:hypothetical protein